MDLILAGRGRRLSAVLIDGMPLIVLQAMRQRFASKGLADTTFTNVFVVFLLVIIVYALYQIAILSKDGQTIGKKLLHIKIVDAQTGQNGGFVPNVLKRSLLNGLLNIIPFYFIADDLFIFRDDRRCIHDFIAGTKVVQVTE